MNGKIFSLRSKIKETKFPCIWIDLIVHIPKNIFQRKEMNSNKLEIKSRVADTWRQKFEIRRKLITEN